jgi:hypothetical protein
MRRVICLAWSEKIEAPRLQPEHATPFVLVLDEREPHSANAAKTRY